MLRPCRLTAATENDEPGWLTRLRASAGQRPKTQFTEIRRHDLQELLRERDTLWHAASPDTRATLEATRREYGRKQELTYKRKSQYATKLAASRPSERRPAIPDRPGGGEA